MASQGGKPIDREFVLGSANSRPAFLVNGDFRLFE